MKKLIAAILGITFLAFGLLVAASAAKKRDFTGSFQIQIAQKDASGRFQIVDEFTAPGQHLLASVADAVGKKDLTSDFSLNGRTKLGHTISARLKSTGKAEADLTTGFVAFDIPVEITIDGKRAESSFHFTTDSTQGVAGTISGRRAKIDQASKTATLAMVSSATLISPVEVVVNHEEQAVDKTKIIAEKKEGQKLTSGAVDQSVLIVISGEGLLKALD